MPMSEASSRSTPAALSLRSARGAGPARLAWAHVRAARPRTASSSGSNVDLGQGVLALVDAVARARRRRRGSTAAVDQRDAQLAQLVLVALEHPVEGLVGGGARRTAARPRGSAPWAAAGGCYSRQSTRLSSRSVLAAGHGWVHSPRPTLPDGAHGPWLVCARDAVASRAPVAGVRRPAGRARWSMPCGWPGDAGDRVRALAYPALVGEPEVGDRVLLNASALLRGLGTGGLRLRRGRCPTGCRPTRRDPAAPPATSSRRATRRSSRCAWRRRAGQPAPRSADLRATPATWPGMPVVVADLHSALPAVLAGLRADRPDARVVYLMTDGGALPIAFSRTVAGLREAGLAGTARSRWARPTAATTRRSPCTPVCSPPSTCWAPTSPSSSRARATSAPAPAGASPAWRPARPSTPRHPARARRSARCAISDADARERHRGDLPPQPTAYGRIALVPADLVAPTPDGRVRRAGAATRPASWRPGLRHGARSCRSRTDGLDEALRGSPVTAVDDGPRPRRGPRSLPLQRSSRAACRPAAGWCCWLRSAQPWGPRSADVDEVDDEDQGLARLDRAARATVAVARGAAGWSSLRRPPTFMPTMPSSQPADDLADAEAEVQRCAAVPRGVELLAGGVGHADVVRRDRVTGAGLLAVALGDVLDDELGRGRRLRGSRSRAWWSWGRNPCWCSFLMVVAPGRGVGWVGEGQ